VVIFITGLFDSEENKKAYLPLCETKKSLFASFLGLFAKQKKSLFAKQKKASLPLQRTEERGCFFFYFIKITDRGQRVEGKINKKTRG